MFITTANNRHQIPLPLQDRLEIIELPGYTEYDKVRIAKQHLIPKQTERNGIADAEMSWSDKALSLTVNRYTRESGVRNLDREVAAVCRKVAKEVIDGIEETPVEEFRCRITPESSAEIFRSPPSSSTASMMGKTKWAWSMALPIRHGVGTCCRRNAPLCLVRVS